VDSNHRRRPYESRVAPCVITVAEAGFRTSALLLMRQARTAAPPLRGAPVPNRTAKPRFRRTEPSAGASDWETCHGIEPSHYRFAARSAHQCCTSFERTAGIEPASKNLADFRLTNRPRSQTKRAGIEIRTRLTRLGRPASHLEKCPRPARAVAARSRCRRATAEASGRPYSHRPGDGFGIAGAHVRNRTEPTSIPTRCTSIVLHGQPRLDATRAETLQNDFPLSRRRQCSGPLTLGSNPNAAGRQRIERCPTDLESVRSPWPAPCSASYENRTRLIP
jgi:hypothetical protein